MQLALAPDELRRVLEQWVQLRERSGDTLPLSRNFENTIVLSDEFYEEVTAHPIPTDLEAVKVLSASPAVLDLVSRIVSSSGS